MKSLLKFSIPILIVTIVAGCSSGRLAKIEDAYSQQQEIKKDLMERSDSNAASIREAKNDLAQLAQRLTVLENRVVTSQTDESASIQEIRETLVFLSDQLSRLDMSVQTRTPRPIPKGASVFKPGGFNTSSSYNAALSNYKAKQYEAAISGFKELLTVAPVSSLADNAQYWIGECYDALGNYDQALTAFNKVFDYPKSNKLSDAHVKIGLVYVKMNRNDLAKEELKAVIDNYPGTNAASIAASKLKSLGE